MNVREVIDYPYNLVDAVCGEEYPYENDADHAAGLEKALSTLTDREQGVIRMRFQSQMNLDDAGKEFGVTSERIRQIEAKALRKLRHPARQKYILFGLAGAAELEELNAKRAEIEEREKLVAMREEKIKEALTFLKPMLDSFEIVEDKVVDSLADSSSITRHAPIEDLDLSLRAYNCLKRYGINTVEELIAVLEEPEEIKRVRNLGKKTLEEILFHVYSYSGVDMREYY